MFAHIYNAPKAAQRFVPGAKFQLLITETCELSNGTVGMTYHVTKAEAKAEAKRLGAKGWNY